MNFRTIAGITCLFLFFLTASAQEPVSLTLNQAIEIALDKSFDIKSLEQTMISAERSLWAAKAAYRTNAGFDLQAPIYDEGFTLIDVVDGNQVVKKFGRFQVRGRFDINQPMPWLPLGGGMLTFRSEAYQLNEWTPSRMDPDVDIKSNRFYTALSVRVNKPLFTLNTLAMALKQAELSYERQSRFFKRNELDLVYRVTDAFYNLYQQSERHKINQERVERQTNIYETTVNKFKAGLIAEVEAMLAEVNLIEYQNELKSSEGTLKDAHSAFKQLIGLDMDKDIQLQTELEIKPVIIDQELAVGLALQNRSEIVERQIAVEQQEISIKQIDARVSINGSLSGYYQFSGFSESELPYETPTADLFESSWRVLRETPNRGISFNLEVPVFDWGKNRAEVQAAKADLRREELGLQEIYITIEREVRSVVRRVHEAFDRVQMLTKSREVSQRSFEISLQRFANGDITSTELDRASEQLDTARQSFLSAYIQFQLALADLKRKTLYDFENKRSLVE